MLEALPCKKVKKEFSDIFKLKYLDKYATVVKERY